MTKDYSKGKIYKIVSANCDKVYYGSTVHTLDDRLANHVLTKTCSSAEVINCGDFEIIEIEKYPCASKQQLLDREAEYILRDWDGCVNKHIPGSVGRAGGDKAYKKQDYNKKKEFYKKYMREYTKINKKKISERAAEKIPCNLCGKMMTRGHKIQHQRSKKCQKHVQNEVASLLNEMIMTIENE